jgi:hypothetical protein
MMQTCKRGIYGSHSGDPSRVQCWVLRQAIANIFRQNMPLLRVASLYQIIQHHITKDRYLHKKQDSVSPRANYTDRRLSAKLVRTFADRGCHGVSVKNTYGRNLGFIDWSHYFFFQVAPQLYSWGWVDSIPGLLLLWKSGSAGNRNRTSESVARNSDH